MRKSLSLFPIESQVSLNGSKLALAKVTDASIISEAAFRSFSDLLLESENLYPGIDVWLKKKVIPGLQQGRRVAYILYHEGKAIAESIVKFGVNSKMCSMRVDPDYQGKGIGPFLFAQIAREIDYSVKSLHFTAPESLVHERKGLFDDLGFVLQGKSRRRYRVGEDELVFKGSASEFKKKSLELIAKKISKNIVGGFRPGVLISIQPVNIYKILSGEKTVELRRKFSADNKGSIALLYATKPIGEVLGDALINDVVVDNPEKIWKTFHSFIGCNRQEFDEYAKGARTLSAILLSQVSQYPHPFEWNKVMEAFVGISKPPQSHQLIPVASLSFWGTLASSTPEFKQSAVEQLSLGF